ncbi:phosphate ABC transporter, permease PstA [Streptococcus urinalis FB127-CNA-2]|uniref:Phosphate transport system permease protein PstA n=1 Tax=Streptococcus urinalis 2285-97 TaxID=764291 RepID=G5KHW6_9STRE|nr:phosphate ABC transporter permease PstA [Streptococcus urinalis]EHJ57436.1 phosphate ABC transporter, permease protein PstA [Streptococcus urinalis 2285-97]EKS22634.1 phosphate ABC transporter, permease PstA [Streptococcus urinalis FB127-CNA-2]VEF32403.1 phosphate ABC transporter, permease protein [Streptococcus urinalis]
MSKYILKTLVYLFSLITFGSLFLIIGFILIQGLPHLTPSLFSMHYTSENVSLMPSILVTVVLVFGSLLIALPIGIFAGFYLVEYAKKGSWWVKVIRIASDTLSGIPSIVFGLFGMLFFVIFLKFQYSLLSGILTSVIMVLPVIIRSTEESLLSVSDSMRQASFGLGAGKLRTVFRIVLPVAMPGILSGVILAIGRIVGETAALMYTLGTSTNTPTSLLSSGRSLALHMYMLSSEGLHVNEAYATGVVLIITVLIINSISSLLSRRLVKGDA